MAAAPQCEHDWTGRMAYPTGMPERGQSHASVYVCDGETCQAAAAEWVRSITGHPGEFVPFPAGRGTAARDIAAWQGQRGGAA